MANARKKSGDLEKGRSPLGAKFINGKFGRCRSTSVTSKSGRKSLPPNYSPTLSHNAPTQTDPSSAPEILEISNGRFGKFVEEWSKFT